uniref:Uncharacterized protein TCIL3000_11_7040 n=1 Tax=Trypanosoma congolense (strain IL3000) TaxID=1068625 RepID=G0V0V8_TRYCI|nr:unnamed protein product [Trypanosoma congolense IL3000]
MLCVCGGGCWYNSFTQQPRNIVRSINPMGDHKGCWLVWVFPLPKKNYASFALLLGPSYIDDYSFDHHHSTCAFLIRKTNLKIKSNYTIVIVSYSGCCHLCLRLAVGIGTRQRLYRENQREVVRGPFIPLTAAVSLSLSRISAR